MSKAYELAGEKFGALTVLRRASKHAFKSCSYVCWECVCDCGKQTILPSTKLMRGRTTSCGCHANYALPRDEASFNYVFRVYEGSAKQKGLTFELDKIQFRGLTSGPCFYCGAEPLQVAKRKYKKQQAWKIPYKHNGLDRLDSAIGYKLGNCVPCCSMCNYMKNDSTVSEFLEQVRKIALHQDMFPQEDECI